MKRLLIASLFGAFAFAASAHPPSSDDAHADAHTQTHAEAQTEAAAEAELDSRSQAQQDADRNCLRYTGSRITQRHLEKHGCISANGRVYSQEDIRRTGATDIADALRMLDPSIR